MRLARGTPTWLAILWLAPLLARRTATRGASLVLAATATWFFRDPSRTPGGSGLLAPADGRVLHTRQQVDGRWLVSVYLDLTDVHVTRAPSDGVVVEQTHHRGTHRPAFHSASHTNERLDWVIETPRGELRLTQYAGTMARRIVAHLGVGDPMCRGDRIGLIRFGSRVDLVLPPGVRPGVREGDRVRGGATPVEAGDAP